MYLLQQPPGPVALSSTDEIQIVSTNLPRVAPPPPTPLRDPLSLSAPVLGPNLGNISITKKVEPKVVDANKARVLALNGLSLTTSPTNKQNAPNLNKQNAANANKQVFGNKQKPMPK